MRITDEARNSVVVFGVPSATSTGAIDYGGTGFFVEYTDEELFFRYLVTNRHVAKALEKWTGSGFYIRANLKGGESFPIPVDHILWAYHPDETVDVAVTPFGLDPAKFDVMYWNLAGVVQRTPTSVMCGDNISIIGLFRLRAGSKRNVPIVHTGNIASLPDPNEKVPTENPEGGPSIMMEAYLVEAQTLKGLSGSPVFLHAMVGIEFGGTEHVGAKAIKGIGVARLLGIYQGAWDGKPGEVLAADRDLRGNLRVPVGMGVVVPAEKITELVMNDPKLKELRAERLREHRATGAASPDSSISAPPTKGENPQHEEDFRRLVTLAARTRRPDDGT